MSEFDDDSVIPLQSHQAAHDPTKVFDQQQFEWFLLRYAEVGLMAEKGRQRMEKTLKKHLFFYAKQVGLNIKRAEIEFGRIVVQLGNPSQKATNKLLEITQKIFGIVSISPALRSEKDLIQISKLCCNYTLKFLSQGQSFAIKVKGEQSQFRREDVAKNCQELILKESSIQVIVNLHEPDLRIFVEIRKNGVFIYSLVIPTAWGGLPTDKEMGIITQFIGNPTELVSAIRMMRRGSNLFPVVFRSIENQKLKYYWDRVDGLVDLLPFSRVYGIEFNLDAIHRRLEKKLTRIWADIDVEWKKQTVKNSNESFSSTDAMHQGIFCLLCMKLRFGLINRILTKQKELYASCLASEGEFIIESNLFLEDRWAEHPVGAKKAVFTPSIINSEFMSKMELYRVRFKAQLTGLHENMICPYDPSLFTFTLQSEFPFFHAAFVLDPENIIAEFNKIAPKGPFASKEQIIGPFPSPICSHQPKNSISQEYFPLLPFILGKINLDNLIDNIFPEGQIIVSKETN
jgi:tRNA(Ser,Leu) C12 N-acetylase TAN1